MKFSEIIKHKHQGSGLLVIAIVSAVIVSMTALSVAKVNQLAFSGTISNRIALQAQQYAVSKMSLMEAKGYANLASQAKTTISGSSFSDSVTVGSEYNGTNGVKCKDVTVNVFYDKNTVSSFSLKRSMYKAAVQPSGSQIVTGTNNVSFTAGGAYNSVTVIVSSKFTPKDASWSGNATFNVLVNGGSVGSVSTTTSTSKAGSKGHYWGTTHGVTNQITVKKSIASGNTVAVKLASSAQHSGTTVTVILGN